MSPLEQALAAMGYRRPLPGKPHLWAKPFGYAVLCCDTERRKIWQTFLGADGELHNWAGADIPADCDDPVAEIKEFETWEVRAPSVGFSSTFHFVDQETRIGWLLDNPPAMGGDDA
jgi:hypothetical protein